MTFKELKLKIKEEQKDLAHQIKIGKPLRKPRNYDKAGGDGIKAYHNLEWNRDTFRHRHITYCHMFNGTPYEKIENPRDGNGPSSYQLEKFKKEWEEEIDDETLRDCA